MGSISALYSVVLNTHTHLKLAGPLSAYAPESSVSLGLGLVPMASRSWGVPPPLARCCEALLSRDCIRKPRGCATTALATHNFAGKDPLVCMAADNVIGFVQTVEAKGRWNCILDEALGRLPNRIRLFAPSGPQPEGQCLQPLRPWAIEDGGF